MTISKIEQPFLKTFNLLKTPENEELVRGVDSFTQNYQGLLPAVLDLSEEFLFPGECLLTERSRIFSPTENSGRGRFKEMKKGIWVNRESQEIREVAILWIGGSKPKETEREIELLKQFKGQGIVPELIEHFEIERGTKKILILIESLCRGGDLQAFAKLRPSKDRVSFIVYQILRIVEIFHTNRIVLRDIKPANFLLEDPDGDEIVICDLEFAQKRTDGAFVNRAGTPLYLSPELASSWEENQGTSNQPPADVWAVGRTLIELLKYQPLIEYTFPSNLNQNQPTLLKHLSELAAPPQIPSDAPLLAQFAALLLQPDPDKRLSTTMALQNRFLKKSLLSNIRFLRALIEGRLSIENVYKDFLGQNFQDLLKEHKSRAEKELLFPAAQRPTETPILPLLSPTQDFSKLFHPRNASSPLSPSSKGTDGMSPDQETPSPPEKERVPGAVHPKVIRTKLPANTAPQLSEEALDLHETS